MEKFLKRIKRRICSLYCNLLQDGILHEGVDIRDVYVCVCVSQGVCEVVGVSEISMH